MIYTIKNLHFSYTSRGPEVLKGVDFSIGQGEICSMLGKNGSGKTTLFACMLGLKKPKKGSIHIQGKDIHSLSEREIAKVASYVPQSHHPAFSYTVEEFIVMGCAANISLLSGPGEKECKKAQLAMEKLDISHLSHRPYTDLSGGERQQVTIARAIVAKPKIILFDEPTAHLDFANQVKVLRIIKNLSREGYAVLMSTHDPNHALLLGGNTAIMDGKGKLTWGETSQIITQDSLESVYGRDICLRQWPELGRSVCLFPDI